MHMEITVTQWWREKIGDGLLFGSVLHSSRKSIVDPGLVYRELASSRQSAGFASVSILYGQPPLLPDRCLTRLIKICPQEILLANVQQDHAILHPFIFFPACPSDRDRTSGRTFSKVYRVPQVRWMIRYGTASRQTFHNRITFFQCSHFSGFQKSFFLSPWKGVHRVKLVEMSRDEARRGKSRTCPIWYFELLSDGRYRHWVRIHPSASGHVSRDTGNQLFSAL